MNNLQIIGYVTLLVIGAYGGMLIGIRTRDAEVKALNDLATAQKELIDHKDKLIEATEDVTMLAIEELRSRGVLITHDSFPELFAVEIAHTQRLLANGLRDMLSSWQERKVIDGHS